VATDDVVFFIPSSHTSAPDGDNIIEQMKGVPAVITSVDDGISVPPPDANK
jgi:hypothetical protein